MYFISRYSVLNALSEYTYFYNPTKNFFILFFCLFLKIFKSLQCILNLSRQCSHFNAEKEPVFCVYLVRIFPKFSLNAEIFSYSHILLLSYSVQMRENTDQKNSKYGLFPRIVYFNVLEYSGKKRILESIKINGNVCMKWVKTKKTW